MVRGLWMRSAITVLLTLLLFLSFDTLLAFDLTGTLRTSYYGLEGRDADGSEDRMNLFYESISLKGRDLGTQALSFGANVRFRGDASGSSEDDINTRFYSLYLNVSDDLPAGVDLRLGRQLLYSGVGTGHMDGVRARIDPASWISLTGWAGTQVRYGAEAEVASWDEASMLGARAVFEADNGSRLGLGFAKRKRGGVLERKLFGVDVTSPAAPWFDIYLKLDVDLEQDELKDATVRLYPRIEGPLDVDFEYSRRTPNVLPTSFFSIVEYEGYDEVRIIPVYRLDEDLRIVGEYAFVKYEDDNTHRLRGGVNWRNIEGGMVYRQGYAGGKLGAYGSVRGKMPFEMEGTFRLDYAKFNLVDGESLRLESMVAIMRLTRRMTRDSNFVIELQQGRNPVFDSDFRVFLRLNYRFHLRG